MPRLVSALLHLFRQRGKRARDPSAPEAVSAPFDWAVTTDENKQIHTLLNSEAYDEADALLLRLHYADPSSRRIITLLADVAERRGHWKDALFWWSKVTVGRDDKWQVSVPRVRILMRQGHPDQAEALMSQTLDMHQANATMLLFASQVMSELEPRAQARFASRVRASLQEIANRGAESSETLVTQANIARCEGKHEEVYSCLRRAHLLRPKEPYIRALAVEAGERVGIPEAQLSLQQAADRLVVEGG